MRRGAIFVAGLLLVTCVALAMRLPDLGNRPMHGDEAVHAFKCRDLWEKGEYRYDPNEFHGPTIYYAALPSLWLHGRHTFAETREADYRLPIALFGAAMVLLLATLADGLGRRATLWAALLLALSPAFVFYSRYYIQEILLAFLTLGAIGCGWRYTRSRRVGWLFATSVCAGLMAASKETAVLAFVAALVAICLTAVWTRRVDGITPDLRWLRSRKFFAIKVVVIFLTAGLFLTGFLSHPSGALDYFRSYTPWLRRAQGTELHRHAWAYYVSLLVGRFPKGHPFWSEGLILGLALIGTISALLPAARSRFEGSMPLARFLAFFTIVLTAIYSLIPYKTPWCVLSFLAGMILLAGIGANVLVSITPSRMRIAAVGLLLLGGAQLGYQAYRASFVAYSDRDNPYVYAQPVPDVIELANRVETLARVDPRHDAMPVYVFSVDNYYWPLPWYLRRFQNVGYWTQIPITVDAPVVLASPEFDEALSKKLDATHIMNGYHSLRPGVFFEVWIRLDLWKAYLDSRKSAHPDSSEE